MSSYGPPEDFISEVKICLLGAERVGKSCIATRFVSNTFDENSEMTVGAAFMSKLIIVENQEYKLHIWDTAGQEKYKSLAPLYYRNVAAAILVYDITSEKSFFALQEWRRQLTRYGPQHVVIAIAGNKCDKENEREVSTEEAQEYANSFDVIFAETSAKTSKNVNFIFEELCKKLTEEKRIQPYGTSNRINIDKTTPARKTCCSSTKREPISVGYAS